MLLVLTDGILNPEICRLQYRFLTAIKLPIAIHVLCYAHIGNLMHVLWPPAFVFNFSL